MFRHRCEEKSDLERPARPRKVVTLTVISDFHIAVKMHRRRSIRDSAVNLAFPWFQATTELFLHGRHSTPSQTVGRLSQS